MNLTFVLSLIIFFSWNLINTQEMTQIFEKLENLFDGLRSELNELKSASKASEPQTTLMSVVPPSCLAAQINENGIHIIKIPGVGKPFPVFCDTRTAGAGWTVIQRRLDGSENFYRTWSEYQTGFGNLSAEYFLGLENLHLLTHAEPYELYVYLKDFDGETRYAKYDRFLVANESESYALSRLGKYSGDAGDSLKYHEGMPFSTFDNDNSRNNCALANVGAWWYNYCQHSNLNGQYVQGGKYDVKMTGRGICWKTWRGYDYGYKVTQMMIRPRCQAISLSSRGPH